MNKEFKDYLEHKGLEMVQIINVAVPVAFGVMRKFEGLILGWGCGVI